MNRLVDVLVVFLGFVIASTLWQFIRLARWPFRVLFFFALLALVYSLQGCATPPHNPPVGIWEGGMRMPDDAACTINTSGVDPVLESCT